MYKIITKHHQHKQVNIEKDINYIMNFNIGPLKVQDFFIDHLKPIILNILSNSTKKRWHFGGVVINKYGICITKNGHYKGYKIIEMCPAVDMYINKFNGCYILGHDYGPLECFTIQEYDRPLGQNQEKLLHNS